MLSVARLAVRRGVQRRLLATEVAGGGASEASSSKPKAKPKTVVNGDSYPDVGRKTTQYTQDRKRYEKELREARLRIISEVKEMQSKKKKEMADREAAEAEQRRKKALEREEIRKIKQAKIDKELELQRQRKERRIAAGQQSQQAMFAAQREELMHAAREVFEGSENWIVGDGPESMARLRAMIEEAMKPERLVSHDEPYPEAQWDVETETWARYRYGDVEQEAAFKPAAWGLELDTSTLPREALQSLLKQRAELIAAGLDLPPEITERLQQAAGEQGLGLDGEPLGDEAIGDTSRQADLWRRQERLKQESMQVDTTNDRQLGAHKQVGVGSGDPMADVLDEEPPRKR